MRVILATLFALLVASSTEAQIGDLPRTTTTISELSLPADDDSPAMLLRIYYVLTSVENTQRPTAAELVPVVRELFFAEEAEEQGAYLRAINNCLIIRQRAGVHREVQSLLQALDAIAEPLRKGGGFGCGSVIPIVGQRNSAGPAR